MKGGSTIEGANLMIQEFSPMKFDESKNQVPIPSYNYTNHLLEGFSMDWIL